MFDSNVANDNYFFKLNADLTKVWHYSLENKEVRGSAALDSYGNIYFVVEEGRQKVDNTNSKLYLYSVTNNGIFRWSKKITEAVLSVGMLNPAIAADNTIYVGGDKFYAFDTSGNIKWTHGSDIYITNAPIIDTLGNIYINTYGAVISLNSNGILRWSFATTGEAASSPAFSVDYSKVYVAVESTLYCLQSNTGNKIWEFTPPGIGTGLFRATPAVDDSDNIYLGTKADNKSVFYAIKADGSGLLWKNEIGADLYSSPALGNDRVVYFGSEYIGWGGVRFHALDMATGNKEWTANLSNDITWSSAVIADGGILYIACMDFLGGGNAVYAFRTDATGLLQNAGSSRFHGGNSSTGRRE
jgi:outer membrane protein assembly factor BamB